MRAKWSRLAPCLATGRSGGLGGIIWGDLGRCADFLWREQDSGFGVAGEYCGPSSLVGAWLVEASLD